MNLYIRMRDGNICHLDEVGDYAVGSTALYEVPLGGKKLFRVESAKLLQEILQQRHLAVLLHLDNRQ
jgi:hypothetical protein